MPREVATESPLLSHPPPLTDGSFHPATLLRMRENYFFAHSLVSSHVPWRCNIKTKILLLFNAVILMLSNWGSVYPKMHQMQPFEVTIFQNFQGTYPGPRSLTASGSAAYYYDQLAYYSKTL